jgi:two-component system, chemotaxis family, CheB/CheR fusion protein
MPDTDKQSDFDELLDLLKRSRGFDFSGYKRASLVRRVRRRMQMVGAGTYADYIALLAKDPTEEFDHLFNTVLINVTAFFRDSIPWDYLSEEIVPQLLTAKPEGAPIRAWSAGCASGQEAFTLAMVLAEALGVEKFVQRVKIYATDLDEDALTYARAATYTEKEVSAVPPLLLERYFERHGNKFVFRKDMRRAVIFGRNDLVRHAPISRIDVLVCRNTLMYFDAPTQAKIVRRFHFALNEGGFLLLGKAETLSTHTNLFEAVDIQKRVFRRIGPHHRAEGFGVSRDENGQEGSEIERGALCDAAFEKSGMAQFVVSRRGVLALANERARMLFRLSAADIGRAFHDLELSYRPVELRSLIEQLFVDERPVKLVETPWPGAGEERWFDVQLTPIYGSNRVLEGVNVTFDDVSNFKRVKVELHQSHADLQSAYEELQSTNEELETTNEELQSTVEELETTNEELQSTNEELETMNEELQAINEEHGVANVQLRESGEELRELNSYLEAIFASLGGGVAIIDPEMRVKIWNRRAEDLWGIRADEAVNHHFLNLDIGLPVTQLQPIIRASMNNGGKSHEVTLEAVNRRGRKIQCRVISTPLITPDSERPQGAIVVMEETAGAT